MGKDSVKVRDGKGTGKGMGVYFFEKSLSFQVPFYVLFLKGVIAKSSFVCEGASKIAPNGRNEPKHHHEFWGFLDTRL